MPVALRETTVRVVYGREAEVAKTRVGRLSLEGRCSLTRERKFEKERSEQRTQRRGAMRILELRENLVRKPNTVSERLV